jgi:Lipopolysaccharide kinase (Kdo/WaaP) family
VIFIAEPYRQFFRQIGFSPEMIFTEPAIKPWRRLEDRENCTWDIPAPTGLIRLHVKRFPSITGAAPARDEAEGYRLLKDHGIPAPVVAAWGVLDDGSSFIATEDLAGFTPADKLVESGLPFDRLLIPTAELSAKLHNAGLHHRDLYLCHFLARCEKDQPADLRLIDAARVRPLPGLLTRRRWIIKDLSQFWYSTTQLPITDSQREEWLNQYCQKTEAGKIEPLKKSIQRKSNAIGAHDEKLRRRHPNRNISIPRT